MMVRGRLWFNRKCGWRSGPRCINRLGPLPFRRPV